MLHLEQHGFLADARGDKCALLVMDRYGCRRIVRRGDPRQNAPVGAKQFHMDVVAAIHPGERYQLPERPCGRAAGVPAR